MISIDLQQILSAPLKLRRAYWERVAAWQPGDPPINFAELRSSLEAQH